MIMNKNNELISEGMLLTTVSLTKLKDIIETTIKQNQRAASSDLESKEFKLLTTDEVTKIFDVTRQTINNWVKKGLIPLRKMGRRNYYSLDDVKLATKQYNAKGGNEYAM